VKLGGVPFDNLLRTCKYKDRYDANFRLINVGYGVKLVQFSVAIIRKTPTKLQGVAANACTDPGRLHPICGM